MTASRLSLTLGILLLFSAASLAAVPSAPSASSALSSVPAAFPWKDGEQLDYEIRWGAILAAEARFTATQPSPGRWHFALDLQSRGIVESVAPIRDQIYSEVEASPWRSLEYSSDRSEAGTHRRRIMDIDYLHRSGTIRDVENKTTTAFPVPYAAVDDIGSVLYEMRRIDWQPGMKRPVGVYDGPVITRGEAACLRRESIAVAGLPGEIPCLVVFLRPIYDDPVKNAQGYGTTLWIRDDASRVPLRADLKARFGTITLRWVPPPAAGPV